MSWYLSSVEIQYSNSSRTREGGGGGGTYTDKWVDGWMDELSEIECQPTRENNSISSVNSTCNYL